jgi:dolichol-phosphate mannosyltransferase
MLYVPFGGMTACGILLQVTGLLSSTSESFTGRLHMITVILPAYNEEVALPPLLDALAKVRAMSLPDLRTIVVDDGSTDRTAEVVRQYAAVTAWVILVQHEGNQGLSQAIQTGFRVALQDTQSDDVVVTLDADNTQPPDRIPLMVQRVREGYDVVIASRFRKGARVYGVPPLRRLYSPVMSLLFQVAFGIPGVRDYSCGFRAYRAGVLQRAYEYYGDRFITERGFACMVEILLQLSHLKPIRFGEVPFTLRYDLKPTPTKMRVGRTITDTLRLAVRHRFGAHR